MKNIKYIFVLMLVLFVLTGCNETKPVDKEINVTYEAMGGTYNATFLESIATDESFTIQAFNDELGMKLTLFDNTQDKLRWFNKLFLKYNETLDLYEVVYKDAMTAAVNELETPAYDFIIGMHNQFQTGETRTTFLDLISIDEAIYIRFDKDPMSYVAGDLEVTVYKSSSLESITVLLTKNTVPPTLYKEGFTFMGWTYQDEVIETIDLVLYKNDIVLKAKWQGKSVTDLERFLKEYIPLEASGNIFLPLSYSGYYMEWQSSDIDIISASGIYKKPYKSQKVTLTALVTGVKTMTLSFDIQTEGYKSLDGKIASSYIYRGYDKVDDRFFEILDIINTAFIIADEQGNLNGTAYLNNVSTHIMPKAKIHGNYVIMSVAPESSWSVIAESASLRGIFADNIVDMINQYGFDGVDIDWETPYESEKLRYTQLMKIVYEKVKANNPNHLVTTAITGGMWQPPRYDLVNSKQYIDYINLMTYGMTNASGQYQNALYKSTVNDNTEFKAGRTLTTASIDESVKFLKNSYGVSYSKMIVGLAFYGIKQIRTFDQGSNTYSAWVKSGSVYYNDIDNNYLSNDLYIKKYDTNAGVPYILKKDGTEFISYDNPRSILEKIAYVINEDLGGVMFWEYGTDTTNTLLEAIGQGFN